MKKIIGLTGGIGSGKSTVAALLEQEGIPVYYADVRAKWLSNHSPQIIKLLKEWMGEEVYQNGEMNRAAVAAKVFGSEENIQKLNGIIHPVVFSDFKQWVAEQHSDFVVKEAAILFESGSYKDCDIIVTVSADEDLRVKRAAQRDGVAAEKIRERMLHQWDDEMREAASDYVIKNNGNFDELKTNTHQFINWLKNANAVEE